MNWHSLISDKRFGLENYHQRQHNRTDFQRDYDRLIFSSPFRRLQNKTQVFPLPGSIFVHNRLTHSLEVSCVGRSLGYLIGRSLRKRNPNSETPFEEIAAIVSAGCLAHDMGNPPFGHSGERAISGYFNDGNGTQWREAVETEGGRWSDFLCFEGNANTLRLLTHKFVGRREGGFALTYTTLASIVKYPYASTEAQGKMKFGFFQSEEEGYHRIATELGIERDPDNPNRFARHPLVFLVEAADDICYQIMDIEDACKLNILRSEEAIEILLGFFHPSRREDVCKVMRRVDDINEQMSYLRSSIIGVLVEGCTDAFLRHEEDILEGKQRKPLIELIEPLTRDAYQQCTKTACNKIYPSKEVVDVELAGYRIFSHLIDALTEAVMHPNHAYSKLLLNRVPSQYNIHAKSTYGKLLCVLDYISGMTDVYALDLYRKITGMSLPAV